MQLLTKEILDKRYKHPVEFYTRKGKNVKKEIEDEWIIDTRLSIFKRDDSLLYNIWREDEEDEILLFKAKYVEELDTLLEIMKRYENE